MGEENILLYNVICVGEIKLELGVRKVKSPLSEVSLVRLSIGNREADVRKNYEFEINMEGQSCSSHYYFNEQIIKIYAQDLPLSVWEDIANIARASGDLGEPVNRFIQYSIPSGQVAPLAPARYERLFWSDGIETGLGSAKEEIMSYIYDYLAKLIETIRHEKPNQRRRIAIYGKWICPNCGFADNLADECTSCHISRPQSTYTNLFAFVKK